VLLLLVHLSQAEANVVNLNLKWSAKWACQGFHHQQNDNDSIFFFIQKQSNPSRLDWDFRIVVARAHACRRRCRPTHFRILIVFVVIDKTTAEYRFPCQNESSTARQMPIWHLRYPPMLVLDLCWIGIVTCMRETGRRWRLSWTMGCRLLAWGSVV
jgi:hypothetical protein